MSGVDKEFIGRLIRDVHEAIGIITENSSKPFEELNRAERSEVKYHIVVLVEALTTLAYHVARRVYGLEPSTPTQTFRLLADRGLLSEGELDDLVKLVRLRNLIVHRYWIVDDRRIYESVKKNFKMVVSFVKRIKDVFKL